METRFNKRPRGGRVEEKKVKENEDENEVEKVNRDLPQGENQPQEEDQPHDDVSVRPGKNKRAKVSQRKLCKSFCVTVLSSKT